MKILTIANKLYMSYDFFFRHKLHAVEWKLNALIIKNRSMINKFNQKWRNLWNKNFKLSFLIKILS